MAASASYVSLAARFPIVLDRRARPRLAGAFKDAEDVAYRKLREASKYETLTDRSELLREISKMDEGKGN